MFQSFEIALLAQAKALPLEWFVFIASFIEEVIAPIPSLAVLLTTGSAAALQDRSVLGLLPLVLLAAAGKTIGALIVYSISDKFGHFTISKFGRFFNIKNSDLTKLQSKVTNTKKDYLIFTLLRALPIVPSAIVSVGCGVLKIPIKVFVVSTIFGTAIRDGITIYIGYTGVQIFHTLLLHSSSVESVLQKGFIAALLVFLGYLFFKKDRTKK